MKKIICLVLIAICFIACDGRKRTKQIRENSISKFRADAPQINLETYYPEHYVEVVTDTILNTKTHIHIKNYALMNTSVFIKEVITKNSVQTTKYHRRFESEITVYQKSKLVLKTTLNAKNFKYNTSDSFWGNATLEHAWVNEVLSTSKLIHIEFSFINPRDNHYKYYRMEVNYEGKQTVYLLKESV